MNEWTSLFDHLSMDDPHPLTGMDRCHISFIAGALLSKKPDDVLALGTGSGDLALALLKGLSYNKKGQLTCVDDGATWGDKEPFFITDLKNKGAQIIAPMKEQDFIFQCAGDTFDFLIANSDPFLSGFWVDEYLRVVRDGGFIFVHNTNLKTLYPNLQRIEDRFKSLDLFYHHFTGKTRTDENARGLIFAVNDKQKWNDFKKHHPKGDDPLVEKGDDAQNALKHSGENDSSRILYLGLTAGKNYGWGVCSDYLIRELKKRVNTHLINEADGSAENGKLNGALFQALTSIQFFPMFEKARGIQNFGYTFFENELTQTSIENAKKFDRVLGGSSWCKDRLEEKGILNSGVLIQGVDPTYFYPIKKAKDEDRFVLFSGGKFELRKGQDLVLKAFKVLSQKYKDIYLINCWYNIWPKSMHLMTYSKYISFNYKEGETWEKTMRRTYHLNNLDESRIETLELTPGHTLRDLYRKTDVGIFPNRCEGGTNLVLMEYMACGKPVIASNTSGHKDILTSENALLLNHLSPLNIVDSDNVLVGRWEEVHLDELIAKIEYAYENRGGLRKIGVKAGQDLKQYSWEKSARDLINIIY